MFDSLAAFVEIDMRGVWVEELKELLEGDAIGAFFAWAEFLHLFDHLYHFVLINSNATPLVHLLDPFCGQIRL